MDVRSFIRDSEKCCSTMHTKRCLCFDNFYLFVRVFNFIYLIFVFFSISCIFCDKALSKYKIYTIICLKIIKVRINFDPIL